MALLGGLASAAFASPASASPEDVFGYGARSQALGATGAASAQEFEAVYHNPALLSTARERALHIGFQGAVFDLRAGSRLPYEPLRGSVIGGTLPVPFGGALRDRVALGFGFFTPFDLVVRGRILNPEKPQFLLADRTQSVTVRVGLGVDLGHGVRVGGGFAALAALAGSVLVATDATGRVGTVVENSLVASYAPALGASYDLGDDYRVGVAFRGELVGRFDVIINVRDLGPVTVPPLHISGIAQYDPAQVTLELARVRGRTKAALSATYKRWSDYPGPADATVRCPVTDPETGQLFEGSCTAPGVAPPGYSDTVTVRAGVERTIEAARGLDAHLRAGVFLEPTPAPEQTGESNLFDSTRTGLTLGYGLELRPPYPRLTLDLFSQAHYLLPRLHTKTADVTPSNAGAPSVESHGVIVAGGAVAGMRF